ncbi:hypothetical protein ACFU9B_37475 [Streptomyces sp. NPDC057592]|uniref:hypothetical protein n=1 Tax=Streptomyces sp. NPDC057592 TaxID=3346175 RepID=UPI0036B99D3B
MSSESRNTSAAVRTVSAFPPTRLQRWTNPRVAAAGSLLRAFHDATRSSRLTGEERVRAALSERPLIALLIALHSVKETAADGDGDQELATVLYKRVAEGLSGLAVTGRPVTITLDDRAPSGELDTPDEAQTNTTDEQADAEGGDKKE